MQSGGIPAPRRTGVAALPDFGTSTTRREASMQRTARRAAWIICSASKSPTSGMKRERIGKYRQTRHVLGTLAGDRGKRLRGRRRSKEWAHALRTMINCIRHEPCVRRPMLCPISPVREGSERKLAACGNTPGSPAGPRERIFHPADDARSRHDCDMCLRQRCRRGKALPTERQYKRSGLNHCTEKAGNADHVVIHRPPANNIQSRTAPWPPSRRIPAGCLVPGAQAIRINGRSGRNLPERIDLFDRTGCTLCLMHEMPNAVRADPMVRARGILDEIVAHCLTFICCRLRRSPVRPADETEYGIACGRSMHGRPLTPSVADLGCASPPYADDYFSDLRRKIIHRVNILAVSAIAGLAKVPSPHVAIRTRVSGFLLHRPPGRIVLFRPHLLMRNLYKASL